MTYICPECSQLAIDLEGSDSPIRCAICNAKMIPFEHNTIYEQLADTIIPPEDDAHAACR